MMIVQQNIEMAAGVGGDTMIVCQIVIKVIDMCRVLMIDSDLVTRRIILSIGVDVMSVDGTTLIKLDVRRM